MSPLSVAPGTGSLLERVPVGGRFRPRRRTQSSQGSVPVKIDSYRFLPRSFRPTYERVEPLESEGHPVWSGFGPRLEDSRIALLTSAGLYVKGEQEPFDGERERNEPAWGDPSFRLLPHGLSHDRYSMMHLHVDNEAILTDPNIALPSLILTELTEAGVVAGATEHHISVMGYQGRGDRSLLDEWRLQTAPRIVDHLRDMRTDGVVLAPV